MTVDEEEAAQLWSCLSSGLEELRKVTSTSVRRVSGHFGIWKYISLKPWENTMHCKCQGYRRRGHSKLTNYLEGLREAINMSEPEPQSRFEPSPSCTSLEHYFLT
jgi:hypothetical protein